MVLQTFSQSVATGFGPTSAPAFGADAKPKTTDTTNATTIGSKRNQQAGSEDIPPTPFPTRTNGVLVLAHPIAQTQEARADRVRKMR
jgi:hypothetical protein